MTQPQLLSAEVIEASRVPPPARRDWYIVLHLTGAKEWTMFRSGGGLPDRFLTVARAEQEISQRGLRDARIVRIPGEGT